MKNIKIEITGGGQHTPPEMAQGLQSAEADDKANIEAVSPTGNWTPKGLNALVKATNALLPLFGQEPSYPTFSGPLKQLPSDFVRVLMMFKNAIDDAVAEEVVGTDAQFSIDTLTDDTSLLTLAGKLNMLASSKPFKQFLKSPPKDETRATESSESADGPEEEGSMSADQLMASRM
jgi:hypothetical protein